MSFKYNRYINRVTQSAWAITPDKFAIIGELIRERAAGHKPSDEDIVARLGDDHDTRPTAPRQDGAIAVIPIHGVIAHRADAFEASSGGTSTELIGRMLKKAVADSSVASVLLDFDSPGGSVEGVPELAAQILQATESKPIIAQIDALAASAGYWLASQCSEIVCTPSGMAGSIGVFLFLCDESEALAKAGIKVNAISAGDYKLEGAPWAPLTDDARAHYQAQVDAVYRDFLGAVAKGRGVPLALVKKDYGQGRCYDAKESLARGMIDRIGTMDETVMRLLGGRVSRGARASLTSAQTADLKLRKLMATVYSTDDLLVDAEASKPSQAVETQDSPGAGKSAGSKCPACNGAGLKPERFMSDPQGQETCPECNGTGQRDQMEPDDEGLCEEGYELGDDAVCHLIDVEANAIAAEHLAIAAALTDE